MITSAVRPEGDSALPVERACLGADEPFGSRVEDKPWGTLIGVATGSECGWDNGARMLGTPALSLMFAQLRGPNPVAAIPAAFAAASRWLAEDPYCIAAAGDDSEPCLTVVLALCEPRRITLAWVGNDKAYLLRDGRIAAESEEHSVRMMSRGSLNRPLTPEEADPPEHQRAWLAIPLEQRLRRPFGKLFANRATLLLTRGAPGPPVVTHHERRPGDTLLMLGGTLHEWLDWDAGVTAALADPVPLTIARLVAEIDRRDPRRTGEQSGGSDPYGPILLARL